MSTSHNSGTFLTAEKEVISMKAETVSLLLTLGSQCLAKTLTIEATK